METTIPTTNEELLLELDKIYTYYRRKKTEFKEVEFVPLNLWRMNDTLRSEEEITLEAKTSLSAKHRREIEQSKKEIEEKISKTKNQILIVEKQRPLNESLTEKNYALAIKEAEKTAIKNGVLSSQLFQAEILKLNKEKLQKIKDIEIESLQKISELKFELSSLEKELLGVENFYKEIHDLEIKAVIEELKKEDAERVEKAEKYNATQDEKENRHENEILETNARLKISFLDIKNRDYSKEELIQMGYYKKVIELVCTYLNEMEAKKAYETLVEITELVFYLDHYYEILNNTYMMRAV